MGRLRCRHRVAGASRQSAPNTRRMAEREALIREARGRRPSASRRLSPPQHDERPPQHRPDGRAQRVANAVRARARGRPGGGGAPDRASLAAAVDPGAARPGVRCRRGRSAGSQRPARRAADLRRRLGRRRDHLVRGRARSEAEQAHRRRRPRRSPAGDHRNRGHVGDRDGHRLPAVRPVVRGRARARRGARRVRPDGGRAAARLHPPVEEGRPRPEVGGHAGRPDRRDARRRRVQRGGRRACEGRAGDLPVPAQRRRGRRSRRGRRGPDPGLGGLVQAQPVTGRDRSVDVRRRDGRRRRSAP